MSKQTAPKVHYLKTWPEFYDAILKGEKPFEIRRNDRDFRVGDFLVLQEFDSGRDPECPRHQYLLADESCSCSAGCHTGRQCAVIVTYLTDWDQKPGTVVMGIKRVIKGTKS